MNSKEKTSYDTNQIRGLLNSQQALEAIHAHVPIVWQKYGEPREVRIERYWPTRDRSLAVEWSFLLKMNKRFSLYAKLTPEDQKPLPHPCAKDDTPRFINDLILGVFVQLPNSNIVIHSPDCDPQLPHLRELLRPELNLNGTAESSGDGASKTCNRMPQVRNRLLSYRAGRRAAICRSILNKDGHEDHMFCKAYRGSRGEQVFNRHIEMRNSLNKIPERGFGIAEPLQYDTSLQLAKFRWSDGHPISNGRLSEQKSLDRMAKILSALHSLALDDLPTYKASDEIVVVDRWLSLVTPLLPECQETLNWLSKTLHSEAEMVVDEFTSTIHRDFYPKQILIEQERATLLDLDTISQGSACVDIANYLAHVFLSLGEKIHEKNHRRIICSKFLQAYLTHRNTVDLSGLKFYFCTSLVRLGAVHAFRHEQMSTALALWEIAQQTLIGTGNQSMRFLGPVGKVVA